MKYKDGPCVYFVTDGNGNCKIGVASNVKQRVNTMQVNNASPLEIYKVEYFEDIDGAYEAESEYHNIFRNCKVRGEWYKELPVKEYFDSEKKQNDEKYFIDVYPQFSFQDIAKDYMIRLECKTSEEYVNRICNEISSEYLKCILEWSALRERGCNV